MPALAQHSKQELIAGRIGRRRRHRPQWWKGLSSRLEDVERVHHASHVVERSMIDRDAAVIRLRDSRRQGASIERVVQRENFGAWRHHVAHALRAEFDDATDDRDLLALTDTLQFSLPQQIVQCLALDVD